MFRDPVDRLGICQWFHYEADADLERSVRLLEELGVRHVRTGVSWADFHRPRGYQWYRRQMHALRDFDVLLSVWHTPPSIARGASCASPPRRLEEYAEFLGHLIAEFGDCFSAVELWNEPNNRLKWDFRNHDPDWCHFAEMVSGAAGLVRAQGKLGVLGGIIPVDPHWLGLMDGYGVLGSVDAVAIHGFPEMWWDHHPNWEWYRDWRGWPAKVGIAAETGRRVWVTETGLATVDLDRRVPARHGLQVRCLMEAAAAPAERVYWYSLVDLDPARPAIEGFHVDENEYHLGLVAYDGRRKPAWDAMRALLEGDRPTRVPRLAAR